MGRKYLRGIRWWHSNQMQQFCEADLHRKDACSSPETSLSTLGTQGSCQSILQGNLKAWGGLQQAPAGVAVSVSLPLAHLLKEEINKLLKIIKK